MRVNDAPYQHIVLEFTACFFLSMFSRVWTLDPMCFFPVCLLFTDRRDRVRNDRVRQIMEVENDIVFDVMTKQLVWYGHVNRMTEERLPKKMLDWVPPGRRRRGRPMKGWREGIEAEMLRCSIPQNLWFEREQWRLGVVEREGVL